MLLREDERETHYMTEDECCEWAIWNCNYPYEVRNCADCIWNAR